MVAKILEVVGDDTAGGYDIGCNFQQTVLNSTLGPEFLRRRSSMMVNAFHGYSHNYACQNVNHPTVREGTGLEDFETMERVFSSSNQLAPVTRYASAYRRRVFIDMFFRQWDEDKYTNLMEMIYNNIIQALGVIKNDTALLEGSLSADDLAQIDVWEKDEAAYVATLGQEEPYDIHAAAYVKLLEDLAATQ